jgi:FlaG/FlaF family flagellin (archaellin)
MKLFKKCKKNEEAVSAVIGAILMVAVAIAMATVTYLYLTGQLSDPASEAENAVVDVKTESGKIKITLVKTGENVPDDGYSFSESVSVRVNGSVMGETGISSVGWIIGAPLFIGYTSPNIVLDDSASDVGRLAAGTYSITVTIYGTVIYDGLIKVD